MHKIASVGGRNRGKKIREEQRKAETSRAKQNRTVSSVYPSTERSAGGKVSGGLKNISDLGDQ